MLGRNLGLAVASALGASAFLIPAGIAPSHDEAAPAVAFSVINPKNQVLRVPCPACLFPSSNREAVKEVENEEDSWFQIQSASNDVVLNFTVSDEQTLELNGATIYASDVLKLSKTTSIYVDQVSSSASDVEIENGEADRVPLEVTALELDVSGDMGSPSGDSVVTLRFNPLRIENKNIGFDEVAVELLKTVEGELLILNVESAPSPFHGLPFFKPVPADEVEEVEDKHCGPFCRIKSAIETKINDLESFAHSKKPGRKPGCGGQRRPFPDGKLPTHIKPGFLHPDIAEVEREDFPPPPFHGRPRHFGGPHGRHHHHRHSFIRFFFRGLLAVAIPILTGIAVGMFCGIVGLLVGRFIGFLWFNIVRGGRRGYESVDDEEYDEQVCTLHDPDVVDEKVVFVEETGTEAPPVYENAPAYEEAQKSER